MARVYRGFSTKNWGSRRSFSLNDIEIVKQDLLNHIYTIKGERVMMPNFGTRIPTLAFEPADQKTIDILKEDLLTVVKYDPRVKLMSDIKVLNLSDNNALVAFVDLLYIEFNVRDSLRIEVQAR